VPQKVALYASVGADLTHYDVDVAGAALIRRATVTLPRDSASSASGASTTETFRAQSARD